jgi:ubiquinone/menaquinone biosynthesis C-methylase UbiE
MNQTTNQVDSNNEFIRCWNEILVPKWNRFRHILSGNGKIHSDTALELLDIRKGDRVLDVGCGYGETSLQFAEKVGPTGTVVGIDCTEAFLKIGRNELEESSLKNVEYILGDAQDHSFCEKEFDLAFSRFGVMFFENRIKAMKNIYRGLKPGGKMMLIVWRPLKDNYCWNVGKTMALKYLKEPEQIGMTCGPGPFSMGNEEMTRGMLKSAGFNHVELFQQNDVDVFMGNNLEEAIDFQLLVGPSGELIRESGDKGQEAIPQIREDLREEMGKYLRGEEVWMPSSAWLIVATKK